MTRTLRRPGITLTEVLVALFVMAVGMIALLVMFPLGAQQIAQAIKDERSAQAANNADALLRDHWRMNVVDVIRAGIPESRLVNPADALHVDYMIAMERPSFAPLPSTMPAAQDRTTTNMPNLSDAAFLTENRERANSSYPVFLDPYGDVTRTSVFPTSKWWVAGVHQNSSNTASPILNAVPRIPRRTLNFPQTGASMGTPDKWSYRYATLMDDLDFNGDGGMNQLGTATRTGRYNWAWVLQRPTQGNRLVTNMTVVVYDQRAFNFARPEDEIAYPFSVAIPPVGGLPNPTQVTIFYDTAADLPVPSIRAGQWVMDGTQTIMPAAPNAGVAVRSANFYRVVAVTDHNPGGTAGSVTLDLQTPLKLAPGVTQHPTAPLNYPTPATGLAAQGQLYILRGVAEVFERRPLTTDDTPLVP